MDRIKSLLRHRVIVDWLPFISTPKGNRSVYRQRISIRYPEHASLPTIEEMFGFDR